jgi:hypothetical protein
VRLGGSRQQQSVEAEAVGPAAPVLPYVNLLPAGCDDSKGVALDACRCGGIDSGWKQSGQHRPGGRQPAACRLAKQAAWAVLSCGACRAAGEHAAWRSGGGMSVGN